MNKPIIAIPLTQIDVGPRLRPVDPAWVELLAASLAERGQDTPITVRPAEEAGRYMLVAGGHRVAAAEVAGLEALDAFVTEATDDEATLGTSARPSAWKRWASTTWRRRGNGRARPRPSSTRSAMSRRWMRA
jgi:uncharacterized ParB-like nuclease family protein